MNELMLDREYILFAAYARTRKEEDATDALEQLMKAYRKILRERREAGCEPNILNIVRFYADSGSSNADFERLMKDCEKGNVNMILTRSLSSFCRSPQETAGTILHLKKIPVGVFFQDEGLCSLDDGPETALQIHSLLAEQESRQKSRRMTFRIEQQKDVKHG